MKKAIVPALFLLVIITNAWLCNLNVYSRSAQIVPLVTDDTIQAMQRARLNTFATLDDYARNTPEDSAKDIHVLAAYLIKPAKNDLEKARVLFAWIATHIKYDVYAFTSGNPGDCSAANVLKRRRTVCEGYSNLYKELATLTGLQAERIDGYGKGYGYKEGQAFHRTNHSWNAIKLDNEWHLFDVTWASSYVINMNGNLVGKSRFETCWFDVPPKAFIFTHLPVDDKWQLNDVKLDLKKYTGLPYPHESFFKIFDESSIFEDALNGKATSFVQTGDGNFQLRAVNVPYTGILKKDEPLSFIFESDSVVQMAVVTDGKDWHFFTKNGNRFSIDYTPAGKEVMIAMKLHATDKSFANIATYQVSKKGWGWIPEIIWIFLVIFDLNSTISVHTLNTILKEIKNVPTNRLEDLYQFMRSLIPKTKKNSALRDKILSFAGAFSDMKDEDYTGFINRTKKIRTELFDRDIHLWSCL